MPSPKSHRNHTGRLSSAEKSSSFNGQNAMSAAQIRRPRTMPDLIWYRNSLAGTAPEGLPRQPPKLLLKVTVLGSVAPLQVLIRPELTVGDLVATALRQYVKEGRRPILPAMNSSDFDLHYSQFSLESLDKEEKLMELGSRNFFLCTRKRAAAAEGGSGREGGITAPFVSCAEEAEKGSHGGDRGGFAWMKLMNFLLP